MPEFVRAKSAATVKTQYFYAFIHLLFDQWLMQQQGLIHSQIDFWGKKYLHNHHQTIDSMMLFTIFEAP